MNKLTKIRLLFLFATIIVILVDIINLVACIHRFVMTGVDKTFIALFMFLVINIVNTYLLYNYIKMFKNSQRNNEK